MKSWAYLFILTFFLVLPSLASPAFLCKDLEFAPRPITVKIDQEYVQLDTIVSGQNIIFFRENEYRNAVKANAVPINALIVVDQLPLDIDLPLVAAVFVGKKLILRGTHIQVSAKKMNIPIIYSEGIFANLALKKTSEKNHTFTVTRKNNAYEINLDSGPILPIAKIQSVLPKDFHRSYGKLYNFETDRFTGPLPRELTGDKYFELMRFKIAFPQLVPDISSISSGFYENFLSSYSFQERTLRSLFNQLVIDLKLATKDQNETQIKSLLDSFQKAILNSTSDNDGYDVFSQIIFALETNYHKIYLQNRITPFAIRSNQEVEDLIGAGLYKSTIANQLIKSEIEKNIRLSWASLFEYRAYTLRRYWGQLDQYLSTSLLIHPYVADVIAHSTGSFKINADSKLELEINMVLGSQEKATNPSAKAQVLKMTLVDSNGDNSDFTMQNAIVYPEEIKKTLSLFFNQVKNYIKNEFTLRTYVPTEINIEFVIQKNPDSDQFGKLIVLQYKPVQSREVIIDLLTGLLSREEVDYKGIPKSYTDIHSFLPSLKIETAEQELIQIYHRLEAKIHQPVMRYALLLENKKPLLVIWRSPIIHEDLKSKIEKTNAKWLKSGYIEFFKQKDSTQNQIHFTLSYYNSADVALVFSISLDLFQQALQRAINNSPELKNMFESYKPKIIWETD